MHPEGELAQSSQQILVSLQDLETVVLPMVVRWVHWLSEAEFILIGSIPREEMRHTLVVQDWLAQGRQEGEAKAAS